MSYKTILQPGRNCWRIKRAERVAFLIDADAYFTALHDALSQARQEITILSWDIYSELRLGALQGDRRTLTKLLNHQLKSNTQLKAHILNWDFSMLFSMSREWLPTYKLGWQTHPRLSFQLDNQHPIGASHHQKTVVLDGQLAFTGGLDLTRGRWDTPEHRANDARREKVDGGLGRPHHDVQIALSGDVARAMNELAHERWRRATEQIIPKPESQAEPVWPQGLEVDLQDVDVAISRTEAAYQDYQEIREIEQLYLDSIEAAQDYIYIENQFYTCPGINAALVKRLQEQHGPEVIINLPLETDGWLSQNSMDVIRVKLLQELREADRHQRLGVYYPYKHDLESMPINLHAKVMIVDDRFVRVGSSNINNRSMGLDTECDVAIECTPQDERIKQGVIGFRDRLLSEHLGIATSQFHDAVTDKGSLLKAVESQRQDDKERTLKPLEDKLPDYSESVLTESDLVDPEQPVDVEKLIYHALPEEDSADNPKRVIAWLAGLLVLLVLAAVWRYTPLGESLDVETVTQTLDTLSSYPLAPLWLFIGFVCAALFMIPVTMLIIASVIVFGPFSGAAYAIVSAIASASAGYAIGSLLGRDAIQGLARGKINRISQRLAKRGVFTVVVLRIVPVAPFTIINLVAGASHIKMRDFFWGTVLGIIPGIAAITVLTDRVRATLTDPQPQTIALLAGIGILVVAASYLLSRYLMKYRED